MCFPEKFRSNKRLFFKDTLMHFKVLVKISNGNFSFHVFFTKIIEKISHCFLHRGTAALRNTCDKGILVKKSNKCK